MKRQALETISAKARPWRKGLAQVQQRLRGASLSLAALLLLLGCSSSAALGDTAGPLTAEIQPSGTEPLATQFPASVSGLPTLGVLKGERATPLENGAGLLLGNGVVMEVYLAPYPPEEATDLHLFILQESTYEPVTDASVYVLYEMFYMDHGEGGKPAATEQGPGHFVFPLYFIMYGEYKVTATISWWHEQQLMQEEVQLLVVFYPSELGG